MSRIYIFGAVAVIAAGLIGWAVMAEKAPSKLDGFAQCINDSGTKFYGAFWCPHCANQKKMFGTAADKLPYVECSTPDGNGQLPVCTEKEVKGYPTWVFPNGERLTGEVELATLAEKTSCTLPE